VWFDAEGNDPFQEGTDDDTDEEEFLRGETQDMREEL
jgi:hypothetical protein